MLPFLALLVAVPAFSAPVGGPTRIGVATTVRGFARIVHAAPGAVPRLKANDPVYLNDKIVTDNVGEVRIKFDDETAFSIGPNTTVTLDKYVYDPSAGAAEMLVSVLTGVFHFVSGKIAGSGPLNMKVRMPVCTLGIHGTEVAGNIDGEREATIYHLAGHEVEVTNGYGTQTMHPGFMVNVKAKQAPGAPAPIPATFPKDSAMALPLAAKAPAAPSPTVSTPAAAGSPATLPVADMQAAAVNTLQQLAAEYIAKHRTAFMRLVSDDFLGNEETLEEAILQDFRTYASIDLQIIPNRAAVSKAGNTISVLFRYNLVTLTNQGATQKFSGQAEYVFRWERGRALLYKMNIPFIFGNSLAAQLNPMAFSQGGAIGGSTAPGAANACSGGSLRCGSGYLNGVNGFNFPQGVETPTLRSASDVVLSGGDIVGENSTNKVSDIGACDLNTLTTVATPTGNVVFTYAVGDCIVATTNNPPGYFAVMKLTSVSSSNVNFTYLYQSNGTNRFH